MTMWLQDLRYSFKALMRRPALTATSALSLAIGLGGALAIFAAAHAVLFRPLPFTDPERLVALEAMVQRDTLEARAFSVPDFIDYRDATSDVLPQVAAWDTVTFTLRAEGPGSRTPGEMVSASYFGILGVQPIAGNLFEARDIADSAPAMLIGEGVWERLFARDPAAIGRTVLADEQPFTIVGVMPASFRGVSDTAELWVPFAVHDALVPRNFWDSRGTRWHSAIARLAEGASLETADAALKSVAARLAAAHPSSNATYTAQARTLRDVLYGDVRPQLLLLLGAVGVVLFMTCVNVANLLVARLSSRQYEFAVRASLGASRQRLMSLAAADGLTLAVLGALVGAPLTSWLVAVLRDLDPASLPTFAAPSLTGPVVPAGIALTLVAAAFIAVASVLSLGRRPAGVTAATRSTSDNARTVYLRRALTTLQVACATALLTAAVLLGLSFRDLTQVEPGFRTAGLLATQVDLPTVRYEPDRRNAMKVDLFERLQAIPGVRQAALGTDTMLGGSSSAAFYAVDIEAPTDAEREGRVYVHQVTHNFFDTAGIPLIEGTTLPVFDGQAISLADPDVPVVVSAQLARRFWPGVSAVGQRMKLGRSASERPWMRIVGVVGDTKFRGLPNNPTDDPDVYLPLASRATPNVSILLHSDVSPLSLTQSVEDAIQAIDPLLAPYGAYAMTERVDAATAPQRFLSQLSTAFGIVALLLAIVGTYGVVTYQVLLAQRAIGIRLALGAMPRQVFANVMGHTARFVTVGLAGGTALAWYSARAISEQLFRPPDSYAPVIALVAGVVLVVACASAWLPARRAMKVDPIAVLRAD